VQPPYLIMDGRRMIPDHWALVSKGYSYLSVGGQLLTSPKSQAKSGNGQAAPASEPVKKVT
ncbi:MAG: hypothetical protein JSW55_09195, partial [Chloroflexota bacterium]